MARNPHDRRVVHVLILAECVGDHEHERCQDDKAETEENEETEHRPALLEDALAAEIRNLLLVHVAHADLHGFLRAHALADLVLLMHIGLCTVRHIFCDRVIGIGERFLHRLCGCFCGLGNCFCRGFRRPGDLLGGQILFIIQFLHPLTLLRRR